MTNTPTQLPTTGLEFVEVICYLAEFRPDGSDADADPDLFTIGGTVTLSVDTDQNLLVVRQGNDPARLTRVQDLSFTIQTSTGALVDDQGRIGFKIPRSDSTGIEPGEYTLSGEVRFTGTAQGKRVVFKAIPTQDDGKLNIVDTIGLGTMTAAGVSLLPQRVAALEAQSGGGPGTPSAGAYPIQYRTLTEHLTLTIPVDAPTDQPIAFVFTQDGNGGRTVTFAGNPIAVKTAAGAETLVVFTPMSGAWWPKVIEGMGSTGSGTSDTTAPTGGSLAVTGSGDAGSTRTLTVFGATDSGSGLHAQPYRFATDGSTYSAWQSSPSFTTPALAAGTYQPRAQVRDAASTPNVATLSAANFTVNAAAWTPPPVGTPATLADAIDAYGAVGYWKLDETSGTTITDHSGNGHHGTLTGTAGTDYTLAAQDGRVKFLTGVGKVEIPDDNAFTIGPNGLTIVTCFHVTSYASNKNLVTKDAINQVEWKYILNSQRLNGGSTAATGSTWLDYSATTDAVVTANTWTGAAMVMAEPGQSIRPVHYVGSGTPLTVSESGNAGAYANRTSPVLIGGGIIGAVGDTIIFPWALTAAHIDKLMTLARAEGVIV